MSASEGEQLRNGLAALNLPASATQQQKLLDYLALLSKWNDAYNLTAVRDPAQMISRHLLDSLSIAPWIQETSGRFLDVGSGGGLPGIPLAILFARQNWTLVDSIGKKVRFLTQAKLQLGLDNVQALQTRVEQLQGIAPFDAIASRAFAEIATFVGQTRHLGDEKTRWLAMKGANCDKELQRLPKDFTCSEKHPLNVPGCQGKRHLLILRRIL